MKWNRINYFSFQPLNQSLVLSILTAAIPIVFQLFYVRFISYNVKPETYGEFTLLLSLIAASSTIFWTIPSAAFTRYYNETRSKKNFINEFKSLLICVHFFSAIFLLTYQFFDDKFANSIIFLLLMTIILQNSISLNKQIVLQNLFRKQYLLISVSEKILKYVFPILMFYLFGTLESLVIGMLLSVILVYAISLKLTSSEPFQFHLIFKKIKIYFLYAYPLVFTSIFSWIIVFSDRMFISFFLGDHQLGIYVLLGQVASFAIILNVIFSMYVNPIIYKIHGCDRVRSFAELKKYISILSILLSFIVICMMMLPKEVFYLLINPDTFQEENNYNTLILLFLASILSVFQNSMSLVFTLNKRLDVLAWLWGCAAFVNFAGNFLIGQFGIIMAAVATAVAYGIIVVANLYWLWFCTPADSG